MKKINILNYNDYLKLINEGLILSHDIDKIENILNKMLYKIKSNNDLVFCKLIRFIPNVFDSKTIKYLYRFSIVISICDYSIYEQLFKTCNSFGFFVSNYHVYYNDINPFIDYKFDESNFKNIIYQKNVNRVELFFEAKFSDILNLDKENISYIYHITKEKNIQKILKIGLKPSTQKRKSNHPERIYFFTDIKKCNKLIKLFTENDKLKSEKYDKYVILKIDIKKVNDNVKNFILMNDIHSEGYYTLSNIPPNCIELYENTDVN